MRGYEVYRAADGPTGLDLATSLGPDVIVLDLRLPAMDGREVLRLLRQEPRTKDIPVVILSVSPPEEAAAGRVAEEAQAYLEKPFELDALVASVERWMRRDAGAAGEPGSGGEPPLGTDGF